MSKLKVLQNKIENERFGKRSRTYRSIFFNANKPVIFNRYYCAYCGRLIKKQCVTVDHIYPVWQVTHSTYLRKKLEKQGLKSVNDEKNLVAACYKCNAKKGKKLGLWIIRGKIGKNQNLWTIRHIFRTTIIIGAFIVLVKLNIFQNVINTLTEVLGWL